MVDLINLALFGHPAVLAVERHRYFGFQTPLPLFLPLLRHCHSKVSVSKLNYYSKYWDVVFDTTFDTTLYSLSNVLL